MNAAKRTHEGYALLCRWSGPVCLSIFLLLIRIVWGYGFFVAGSGKLHDISKPIHFFQNLGIPFPVANAWLVACVECFGGLLLLVGFASRPVALVLTINMLVAYLTDGKDALKDLFTNSDPTKFFNYAAFWFLVVSFLVLALGPGMFSIDGILKRILRRNRA